MSVDTAYLDPNGELFAADPHPLFDALRSEHPVVRDPLGWSTIDYATSAAAFEDRALTPGIDHLLVQRGIGSLWGEPGHTLTDSEGEAHRRLRQAVSPWFSARRIGLLRERTVALVDELLDAADLSVDAPFDVMSGLAHVVPARLFCWMVGAPGRRRARAGPAVEGAAVGVHRDPGDGRAGARRRRRAGRVHPPTAARRGPPRRRPHRRARRGRARRAPRSPAMRSSSSRNCSAHRWTTRRTPPAWRSTRSPAAPTSGAGCTPMPTRCPAAVEECGRFEPAIRHTIKCALEPTTVGGQAIAEGEFVTIRIAAANRDPAVYVEPHRFWPRATAGQAAAGLRQRAALLPGRRARQDGGHRDGRTGSSPVGRRPRSPTVRVTAW